MPKLLLARLRALILGYELSDALQRNSDAADRLDLAIREMLEK